MLDRVLEPEVMDDPSEAAAYHAMNHDRVNSIFVEDMGREIPLAEMCGPILDLGAGNGLIPLLIRKQVAKASISALDAARSMLAIAQRVAGANHAGKLGWVQARAQRLPYGEGVFPLVVSNSLIHHLPDPRQAIREAWRVLTPGGWIFFRDLFRPETREALSLLVAKYAGGESDTAQRLFAESLNAALTVEEVRRLVATLCVPEKTVWANSDRHWTWCCRKPQRGQ